MNFLSLGENCQTAYQIRRWTNCSERYFFDWLISDITSVENVFANFDNDGFLLRENLKLTGNAVRVQDTSTGITFQHDFSLDADGLHTTNISEKELLNVRKKYIYLREKTLKYVQNNLVTSIYYDWRRQGDQFCAEVLARLSALPMTGRYGKVIVASEALTETKISREGTLFKLDQADVPDPKYKWRGNDAGWDKLFQTCTASDQI